MIEWWNSLDDMTKFAIATLGWLFYLVSRIGRNEHEIDTLRRRVRDLENGR